MSDELNKEESDKQDAAAETEFTLALARFPFLQQCVERYGRDDVRRIFRGAFFSGARWGTQEALDVVRKTRA